MSGFSDRHNATTQLDSIRAKVAGGKGEQWDAAVLLQYLDRANEELAALRKQVEEAQSDRCAERNLHTSSSCSGRGVDNRQANDDNERRRSRRDSAPMRVCAMSGFSDRHNEAKSELDTLRKRAEKAEHEAVQLRIEVRGLCAELTRLCTEAQNLREALRLYTEIVAGLRAAVLCGDQNRRIAELTKTKVSG